MQQNQNKQQRQFLTAPLTRVFLLGLMVFVLLFNCVTPALAKTDVATSQLIEYLTQEKTNLNAAITEMKELPATASYAEYQKKLQENNALVALNRAKIASLESFLVNQKKLQFDFGQRLKQLQQFSTPNSEQEKIEQINTLNEINKKTIDLINDNLVLANRYQDLLVAQSQQLDLWHSKDRLHEQLAGLQEQETRLNTALQKLYTNSLQLQEQIRTSQDFKGSYLLEARLLLNNELINLNQHKVAELNLQRQLAKADFLLLQSPDIRTLQTVTDSYKNVISQLSDMEQSLKKMMTVLKNELPHISDLNLKNQFLSLIKIINSRITGVTIQEQTLQEDLENHQQELKKQLAVRQSLSEYRMDGLSGIANQLFQVPSRMYAYMKTLLLKTVDNYLWQDRLPAVILWVTVTIILLGAYYLYKLLREVTQDKTRSRLSGHLYDGVLTLFSLNLPHLTTLALAFIIFYSNQIPYASYQLLFNLTYIWLLFRSLIIIARLALLERLSDSTGSDVRLYYRIKWLLLAGGWTMALMVLSTQLPLSPVIQDICNRLLMLFLLAVSLVFWKSKDVISHLLHPLLDNKKRYFRHAVLLLFILVPLAILTTALLGLVGYINLAWTMSRYQMQLLLVMSGYVLMRGLFFDAMELLSEWMISSVNNGWLWVEVLLKPLDKLIRLTLIVSSIYILFELFDWQFNSPFIAKIFQFAEYPLVNLSGIHITAFSIAESIILLTFFFWAAKWTREFSFRWLYRDARDAGIRNSLSVFTQYAVVLIGSLFAIRILGLDFSGMSMVLGGLAVGMGFGLRDFASNIIGGLILLIERPVREGDLVTIGNFEGQVAHIGIRSMRVSSWDNTEVLIPNAETFNKPFINWTHQNGIVRTVVPIKVSREDDPIIIQQLIYDVLAVIPEIVNEPPAQVFLKQIDEALIEFEVRYFIDVQRYTRFEVRSKVLFAITEQFKVAGIKAPIQPYRVEVLDQEKQINKHDSRSSGKTFTERD